MRFTRPKIFGQTPFQLAQIGVSPGLHNAHLRAGDYAADPNGREAAAEAWDDLETRRRPD